MDNFNSASPERRFILDDHGWYQPYDYWFSLWGLYDLYTFAFALLGDLRGRDVLDCGCGPGLTSVMLAKRGARVTAFDTSESDLLTGQAFARDNHASVEFMCRPFEELDLPNESFDRLFGTFILHHVDLPKASQQILRLLRPGGRAVFIENSARNPLLMAARAFVCGRFGIPKFSDGHEHPLTKKDLLTLQQHFTDGCRIHFPDFLCFRLIDFYILQKRWPILTAALQQLDRSMARVPLVRQYGYLQIIQLDKPKGNHG